MSQPIQPSGTGRPTFGGFFPIFLTAAVMLLVYYTIDFQVRVSPVIRELQQRTAPVPKTAASPSVCPETPAQLPQPPIADPATSPTTPSASSPVATIPEVAPLVEPVSPEPQAPPASEPLSALSPDSAMASETMAATLPTPTELPPSASSESLAVPTASSPVFPEPAPMSEAAPPASDSASATLAPEVGQ